MAGFHMADSLGKLRRTVYRGRDWYTHQDGAGLCMLYFGLHFS